MGARACAALCLVVGSALLPGCSRPSSVERKWAVMGTYASAEVHATTRREAEEALDAIRLAIDRVDASMSNWSPESALNQLNLGARRGSYRVEDDELYRCVERALELARLTEGAFDPTVGPLMVLYGFRPHAPRVPGAGDVERALRHVGWRKVELFPDSQRARFRDEGVEIDLGGIAKGYALDVAVRALATPSCRAGLIDLGGNLLAWKHPPGEIAWRIGLRDAREPSRWMATLDLVNRAVSTSGDYENSFVVGGQNYGHIMSPHTGRPAATDIISATAVARTGADADASSTALFVAGSEKAPTILANLPGVEAILLVRGERSLLMLASASLEGRLILDPVFAPAVGGRIRYLLPPSSPEGI